MPSPEPDEYLYISPVYLAGPTTGDAALRPLLDGGFLPKHDTKGNIRLTSPSGQLHVDYKPNGLDHTLWTIIEGPDRYTPPTWQATFTIHTPTEITAAFTTALAASASATPRRERDPDAAFLPLTEADWQRDEDQWETKLTAPDQLAALSYDITPGEPLDPDYEPWLMWGGADGHASRWYAAFTVQTPNHLVTASTTRLADTTPVLRHEADIPLRNRDAARITPAIPHAPADAFPRRASAARTHTTRATPAARAQEAATPSSPANATTNTRAPRRR